MSNKHLPRLFAQALNKKRVELFDEFIHPEYNNHNAYVEPVSDHQKTYFSGRQPVGSWRRCEA